MSSFTVTSEAETTGSAATKSPAAVPLGTPNGASSKLHINAAPWTPNGSPSSIPSAAAAAAIHHEHQQQHQQQHLGSPGILRQALCPNFMAHGSCVDAKCSYAHAVDELDATGQMNLMTMMSGGTAAGSPAGGWGSGGGGGGSGWGHQNTRGGGYGRQNLSHGGASSHNASLGQDDSLEDFNNSGPTPSVRRIPGQAGAARTPHNMSVNSLCGGQANQQPQCPPSPGSHSSEISSVSNASGTDGLTASSHHSATLTTTANQLPQQQRLGGAPQQQEQQQQQQTPREGGNYGPHTSPFIKSQMYYSQSANKVSLPERCRYPHPTPGTYYDYLNVKTSVTRVEIEKKYQQWRDDGYKKAMNIDQDRADAMDRLIVDAKNVLCSERMRGEYDAMLPRQQPQSVSQPFRDPEVNTSSNSGNTSHHHQAGAAGAIGPSGTPPASSHALPLAPIYSEGGLW